MRHRIGVALLLAVCFPLLLFAQTDTVYVPDAFESGEACHFLVIGGGEKVAEKKSAKTK